MGAGVDVLDDGIFLGSVKMGGAIDGAIDVMLVVSILRDEGLGHLPPSGEKGGEVRLIQGGDFGTGRGLTDFVDGWVVNAGPLGDVVMTVRGEEDFMISVGLGQKGEVAVIEIYGGKMSIVGILVLIVARDFEEGDSGLFIDAE